MKPTVANTPTDTQVEVVRSFDAPVEYVWKAFTEPELVSRWMLGPPGWSMPVCEMDFRVGGRYENRFRNDEVVGQLIEPTERQRVLADCG